MIQRPRGTRDFGPEEMEKRRYLEGLMRAEAAVFGFREVATPIFEHTELFTLKSGPNVVEEIYAFQDKGGRDISLRPELTAPVMRFFVNDLSTSPRPLKMFYFGQCFRYERPQSGRYREFFQFGAELIGNLGPESDAEVIALAASIMKRIGIKEYNIRIGHIGVLRGMLAEAGVTAENAPPILQKLDKKEYDEARLRMAGAGMVPEQIERVIEITRTVGPIGTLDKIGGDAKAHLQAIFRILADYGITNVEVDLGVVRGLDYYTGMVFEMDAPSLGAEKQICGGGSYSLTELFGGERTFSTGFGIGFDRTLLALEKEGFQAPAHAVDAYVIPVTEAVKDQAFRIAGQLRGAGVSAEVDLMGRNMSKNFKYAAAINARNAVIVGEKELASGSVAVRDMTSGEQKMVKLEELLPEIERANK
ncbi:histidine--tRNA ligase [Methanomassiliicoccus luminyensis]|uniref:histidine--tRNA ligase n=1 Tax=Methanomassiliicoccus luminyensis TaxID=1080712 RepID=UPI000373C08C|nr:histidine--tRNA ligase [Methanomassiliicoccus luminyensis]